MIKPTPFEIRSELDAGSARLTVLGELDMATAPELEERAQALLDRAPSELIIDLSELTFIDSSGLRLLIILRDRAGDDGWKLGLVRPSGQALSIFTLTGADENLPFLEEPRAP
jgi:anti-anti-sigma factor